MDTKVTLSFNKEIIDKAKNYAQSQGMSLSRLTEFLFEKITSTPKSYKNLDDIPVSDFVYQVAEEQPVYKISKPKAQKASFRERKA